MLQPEQRKRFLKSLTATEAALLHYDWRYNGRPSQQPPPGEWETWVVRTGRGWGKTVTLAEFAHRKADACPGSHGAVVARTVADVRNTVVQGISGILARQKPWNPVHYNPSLRLLTWRNGATAHTYSSEKPDQLRGPNHHWAICDEWASWSRKPSEDGATAWDNLSFGCRLAWPEGAEGGARGDPVEPQSAIGTTPRATKAMRALEAEAGVVVTTGTMLDNWEHLSARRRQHILDRYGGTRLGRQEIEGLILGEVEGAFVTLDEIDRLREPAPVLRRVVVGVDPSGGKAKQGIVAGGIDERGHVYALVDRTCLKKPGGWGKRVIETATEHAADCVAVERNYGGDMAAHVIETAARDLNVPCPRIIHVTASRGKHIRFEPIGGLYEQKRVHHVEGEDFAELEDQVVQFTPSGFEGEESPNNADAWVFAATELAFGSTKRTAGVW